jgi:hypothetical protein
VTAPIFSLFFLLGYSDVTLCGFGNTHQKFARLLGADRLTNPFALPLLEFSMRTFLFWVGCASLIMAGVSVGCGLAGLIGAVETLVFVITFIGLHFLILWELEHTPE